MQLNLRGNRTSFNSNHSQDVFSVFIPLIKNFLFFTPYVCVDEWIECREEVAQDWIRDMKSSDYSALKEKVVSLEEGLRVIGLAQVRIKDCII